jgi:O-antigen/teichoic acid export membrane protein
MQRGSLIRNAVTSYGARGALAVSVFVLTPVLFRGLGVAAFGTWSVVFTFGTVFSLGELGFARGITKVTAELIGTRRDDELARTFRVAVALLAGLGVLAALSAAVVGFAASGLAASGYESAFRWAMLVLAAERLAYFPLSACGATLAGYQRYDLLNAASIANSLGFTAAAVAVIASGGGVLGVVIAWAGMHLASGVLQYLLLRSVNGGLTLRPRLGDATERRTVLAFSTFVLFAESMTFIGQRMDTLVIAAIRNAAAAGPYAAVLKLQTGVQSLTLPFVYLLMPMMSDLWARGQVAAVRTRVALATRVTCQLTLPVAAALALFAGDVVHLWLGDGAPHTTSHILVVLMAAQIPALTAAPAEQVLIGIGRVRPIGLLALVEGLTNLGVSVALVQRYGAIGAAIGTLSTTAVLAPIKLPLVARALEYPLHRLLRESVMPAIAASLPALGVMVAVRLLLPEGAARLGIGVSLGLATALVVAIAAAGPGRLRARLGELHRRHGQEPRLEPALTSGDARASAVKRPNYTPLLADTSLERAT